MSKSNHSNMHGEKKRRATKKNHMSDHQWLVGYHHYDSVVVPRSKKQARNLT